MCSILPHKTTTVTAVSSAFTGAPLASSSDSLEIALIDETDTYTCNNAICYSMTISMQAFALETLVESFVSDWWQRVSYALLCRLHSVKARRMSGQFAVGIDSSTTDMCVDLCVCRVRVE